MQIVLPLTAAVQLNDRKQLGKWQLDGGKNSTAKACIPRAGICFSFGIYFSKHIVIELRVFSNLLIKKYGPARELQNMADIENKNEMSGRRRFLVAATSVAGGIACVAWATPFVLSMMPSERA
ncbi:MAG: ubiquinol-cytochrome c reductase iron-sulfur subunit N-terminal domain-containing protein, partial [Nitrospirota bacterium]